MSAAEEHLAEGKFLLDSQTLNIEMFLIYRAGTRGTTVLERKGKI
jgi:hypothetical protein